MQGKDWAEKQCTSPARNFVSLISHDRVKRGSIDFRLRSKLIYFYCFSQYIVQSTGNSVFWRFQFRKSKEFRQVADTTVLLPDYTLKGMNSLLKIHTQCLCSSSVHWFEHLKFSARIILNGLVISSDYMERSFVASTAWMKTLLPEADQNSIYPEIHCWVLLLFQNVHSN